MKCFARGFSMSKQQSQGLNSACLQGPDPSDGAGPLADSNIVQVGSLEWLPGGKSFVQYSHYSQGEAEAPGGRVVCPGSHCQAEGDPGLQLRRLSLGPCPPRWLKAPCLGRAG